MHREYDRETNTETYACFKCGFRKYDQFPKEPKMTKGIIRKEKEKTHAK